MKFVSRVVVLLRARQPYVDWANAVAATGEAPVTLEDARAAGTAFLVPAFTRDEETQEFIKDRATAMFEHELGMWLDDPARWPTPRDARTFGTWFDVEVHEIVVDLGDDEITSEELE